MPRTLPWAIKKSPELSRTKKLATPKSPVPKRAKITLDIDDVGEENSAETSNTTSFGNAAAQPGRAPSTSPPPEAPTERFMEEGMTHDDRYRMVEDEFLSIAQQFTVHLHTAEYKRQTTEVKARNADTINSISRPVTRKMPDHTKRKIEAVTRSKKQKAALDGLFGRKGDEDDESDAELPYMGTTLHGLMDSPRKKSMALTKFGRKAASAKMAVRHERDAGQARTFQERGSDSPKSKVQVKLDQLAMPELDISTEDEDVADDDEVDDEDDDLDAPIKHSKL